MTIKSLITAILTITLVNVYAVDKISSDILPFASTLSMVDNSSSSNSANTSISYINKKDQSEFSVSSGKDLGSIHLDGLETGTSIYIVDNSGKIYKKISFVPTSQLELNVKDMGAGTFFLCYIKGEDKLIFKLELE